jgi:hypothetical protein
MRAAINLPFGVLPLLIFHPFYVQPAGGSLRRLLCALLVLTLRCLPGGKTIDK